MDILVTLLIGVALGTMVELLLPGHTSAELVLAMLLGGCGALLARFVVSGAGWFESGTSESFVASGVGASLLLATYGLLFRRKKLRR
jgi:LPXTG-motif cell wall-anchored protein